MRAAEGLPRRLLCYLSGRPGATHDAELTTRSGPSTRNPRAATAPAGACRAGPPWPPARPQAGCPADAPGRLRGRSPKRWRKTTIADPAAAARADLIRRDFTADATRLNSRWCGDITYTGTWEGWLYLATVTGIASRRIVGFALADHLRTELIADALANAVAARDPAPGVVFHSDYAEVDVKPENLRMAC